MAKQINTDEEFKLKRQARHRLIGAVALMLAIVIFLPMVFDSEPGVNVGSIELRIPDKTEVSDFRPDATPDQVAAFHRLPGSHQHLAQVTVQCAVAKPMIENDHVPKSRLGATG